jgi:catechol 2,3-dioxygenase-like lactoylglutathione lyase family enzyme
MTDWPHKIDHLSLPVSDLEQAVHFYTAALAPAGLGLISSGEQRAAFGMGPMPYLVVRRTNAAVAPIHLAFLAETRAAVDEFYTAALAAGGTDNGSPGLRPDYHPHYYAAFVLDPDGHNIELVKHDPE